jgi:hypothetical protein
MRKGVKVGPERAKMISYVIVLFSIIYNSIYSITI